MALVFLTMMLRVGKERKTKTKKIPGADCIRVG